MATAFAAVALGVSSWSVASISASSLFVSCGGPFSRSASSRSPGSWPMPCGCSVRVSVSGLYWNAIELQQPPDDRVEQHQPRRGRSRGELGKAGHRRPGSWPGPAQVRAQARVDRPGQRPAERRAGPAARRGAQGDGEPRRGGPAEQARGQAAARTSRVSSRPNARGSAPQRPAAGPGRAGPAARWAVPRSRGPPPVPRRSRSPRPAVRAWGTRPGPPPSDQRMVTGAASRRPGTRR